jgi:hypothetical protein
VDVSVYDVTGRRLVTLARGLHPAGATRIAWDGRDALRGRVPAGVYFVRASVDGRSETRKLVRLD